jgi:hypothetical protein
VTGEVARWRPAGEYAAETLAVLEGSFVEAKGVATLPEGLLGGLSALKYPQPGERAFPSLIEAMRHPPARRLAELTDPPDIRPLQTECDMCRTDGDCQAPLHCTDFSDGTRRCGRGDAATSCRVR